MELSEKNTGDYNYPFQEGDATEKERRRIVFRPYPTTVPLLGRTCNVLKSGGLVVSTDYHNPLTSNNTRESQNPFRVTKLIDKDTRISPN